MEIEIANSYDELKNPELKIHQIITSIQNSSYTIADGILSIVICNEATICRIHEQFLGDPSPTDVITFPGDINDNFTGEIFISVDQAKKNAHAFQTSIDHELTLYLVHGCLHLYGLNDKTDSEKNAMRKGEEELLTRIKKEVQAPPFSLR
jgi:probable rRNA maturation factor